MTRMASLLRIFTAELENVYVFGSWKSSRTPGDVDLLLTYRQDRCGIRRALVLRNRIEEAVCSEFGLPVHTILLSLEEEAEVGFIESEGCVSLF